MKRIALALLSFLPLFAHAGNAKIAELVAKLSKQDDMWQNGWYDSASNLPHTASISDVLDHYVGNGIMFDGTPCKMPYRVVALEIVIIAPCRYTAVLVDNGFGQRIILMSRGKEWAKEFYWAREYLLEQSSTLQTIYKPN